MILLDRREILWREFSFSDNKALANVKFCFARNGMLCSGAWKQRINLMIFLDKKIFYRDYSFLFLLFF